jgi:transcriptional regulator with XRE-family HTH domain
MNRLDILTDALRASFASPRQLAEACGCTPQSAWRYLRGDYVPNVVTLAQLMRRSPALLAAFIEYVGLDDASLERETARLTRLLAELHEQKAAADARLDQVSPAADRHEPAGRQLAGAQAQGAAR